MDEAVSTKERNNNEDLKIPINDKRRFDESGERKTPETLEENPAPNEPQRSPREIELESRLKAETDRREAAESKLVGVQAKFEQAKADLEKETSEMRALLMKTLEDRASQSKFNFLQALLPVLDNLNLAVTASETDASVEPPSATYTSTGTSCEKIESSASDKNWRCCSFVRAGLGERRC